MTGTDPRIRLRIQFGDDLQMGPGKADLLQLIRDTGSISAAGRAMAMSYRRAWSLVEEMNTAFRDPLVVATRGGQTGGGAALTPAGEQVLAHFRALEQITADHGADRIDQLRAMLRD